MKIRGIAYTPERENLDPDQVYFTTLEMTNKLSGSVVGLPVYIEHDTRVQVGTVASAYIDNSGQLIVELYLDIPFFNDSIYFNLAHGVNGKPLLAELSMGHVCKYETDPITGFRRIVEKIPQEVSIVKKGDRPGTFIQSFER